MPAPGRRPALPLPLQRRSSDEFRPPPWSARDREAVARVRSESPRRAQRIGRPLADYCAERTGTAAALLAIDRAWGGGWYDVPEEAARDPGTAEAALGGDELVVDVQTHYIARERAASREAAAVLAFIRSVAPERWRDLRDDPGLSLVEYVQNVFLESETAVAVLTSAPGEGEANILPNREIAGTRELLDRLGGAGRLLHHAIVHPERPGELEAMSAIRERFRPAGWKVYTLHGGWELDDERAGLPFLERSRALGVRIVCAHKGLAALAPTSSPRDVGPAAAAFPELDFLVYHSGYEIAQGDTEEGAYDPEATAQGTDRLVRSLHESGVAPGSNVYAELGSTWFALMRRPREAAHVLGKLLLAVGEDNVLWGTDSVWYGSPQPLIDAFRCFRIPAELCERHGYPPLTPERKAKILGLNAAGVYGIDPVRARGAAREDDLAWARAALAEARVRGTPSV